MHIIFMLIISYYQKKIFLKNLKRNFIYSHILNVCLYIRKHYEMLNTTRINSINIFIEVKEKRYNPDIMI